jgi:hypothetical protein
MNRLMMAAAAGVVVLAGAGMAPSASAEAPARSVAAVGKAPCSTKYVVIGENVAVRRPAWNDGTVARPDSPVVKTLKRGHVVTSCVTMIARTASGPAYHKCGRDGHLWRVAEGGQIPATCLKKGTRL